MSAQPQDLEQQVRGVFQVKQFFALPDGELEFQVAYDGSTKEKFARLSASLAGEGFTPDITGSKDECVLTLRKSQPPRPSQSRLPVIFALFTAATLVVFALLQEEQVFSVLVPSLPGYVVFFAFTSTVALMTVAHEVAQRYVGRRRMAGHANSYLIPAIPFLPPFFPSLGFVSSQREPALNRDRLFDTVLAGPLAILALAIVFYIIGDFTAMKAAALTPESPIYNTTKSINPNLIQLGIDWILSPALPNAPQGYVWVSPIADGATVGFVLVFFGLLPMSFYDGGFLSSSALREGRARLVSYLSVLALLVLETPTYWAMAIIVLLLVGRPFQLRLRDEVSGLSSSRKWILVGSVVLAFLCVPLPHNIGTLPLP